MHRTDCANAEAGLCLLCSHAPNQGFAQRSPCILYIFNPFMPDVFAHPYQLRFTGGSMMARFQCYFPLSTKKVKDLDPLWIRANKANNELLQCSYDNIIINGHESQSIVALNIFYRLYISYLVNGINTATCSNDFYRFAEGTWP